MKPSAWLSVLFVVLLALGTSLSGCSEDENLTRSRVSITRVAAVDDDEDLDAGAYQSDVLDAGDDGVVGTGDDTYYEDVVLVTVANEASSELLGLTPTGPFGSVTIKNYSVNYEVEGEQIESISGGLHLTIRTGEELQARVPLVTAIAKTLPPLSTLATEPDELLGTAVITLSGTEQDSNERITAVARVAVHFANWADN
jgi:hypothetical protein